MLELSNRFNSKDAHPTHLRNSVLRMLLTSEKGGSVPVLVAIEHRNIIAPYEANSVFRISYEYFLDRMLSLSSALLGEADDLSVISAFNMLVIGTFRSSRTRPARG
jgi:hypothetical protein